MAPILMAGLEAANDEPLLEADKRQEGHPNGVHVDPSNADAEHSEGLIFKEVHRPCPEPLQDEDRGDVREAVREDDDRHPNDSAEQVLPPLEFWAACPRRWLVRHCAHRTVPAWHRGEWHHRTACWHLRLLREHRARAHGRTLAQAHRAEVQVPVHHGRGANPGPLADGHMVTADKQVRFRDVGNADAHTPPDRRAIQAQESVGQRCLRNQRENLARDVMHQLVDEPPTKVVAAPQLVLAWLQLANDDPLQC
mmetsp:Transcript_108492/g.272920  ORF Transcript_108492/g.272920 Transcript_108492/m.272920 type:complete len:252 (-) Transcript_108492:1481-2236(-)